MRAIDLTNQKFGRWTVIKREGKKGKENAWRCLCDCGNQKVVTGVALRNGNSKSCGCYNIEKIIARNTKHGANVGGERHPLYGIYKSMLNRCFKEKNAAYKNYGGRGITVHKPWQKSYEKFRDYVLKLPNCPPNVQEPRAHINRQLDRRNNDGNYEPGNLRWATRDEQNRNRRSNVLISLTISGVKTKMPLIDVVDRFGKVPYHRVAARLRRGWKIKDALTLPEFARSLQS